MNSKMTRQVSISRIRGTHCERAGDPVAVEEPLEILLQPFGEQPEAISITMRTPGDDLALAAGFLWGEGVLTCTDDVDASRSYVIHTTNQVCIALAAGAPGSAHQLKRHFYTTSSCGVCGKASLELIQQNTQFTIQTDAPTFKPAVIYGLSECARLKQSAFEETGGLHAAALFDGAGGLIDLKEDVGRHNAVDKLVGKQLLDGKLPLSDKLLFISGRASFELIQKAKMAGIPVVAAVGAPSSLAVELAVDAGITLIGFLRDGRFNIYSGSHRILTD